MIKRIIQRKIAVFENIWKYYQGISQEKKFFFCTFLYLGFCHLFVMKFIMKFISIRYCKLFTGCLHSFNVQCSNQLSGVGASTLPNLCFYIQDWVSMTNGHKTICFSMLKMQLGVQGGGGGTESPPHRDKVSTVFISKHVPTTCLWHVFWFD